MPDVMRFDVPRRTVAENRARASPPPRWFLFLFEEMDSFKALYYFRAKISVFWIIGRGREGDWTKEKNVGKDWYLLIFIENFILFLILS